VGIGIESPNETTLKLMNKKIKTDACHKVVQILKDHKIKGQGFFIIGHYSEGVEETKQYPDFARGLGLRNALFMVMTPYQKKWLLLMNKDVLVTGFHVVRYLVPVLVQGLIRLSVRSMKGK
jgi:hypothetical protein